jgi:hypothetical protein
MYAALARGCCASPKSAEINQAHRCGDRNGRAKSPRIIQDGSTRIFVAAGFIDPARIKRADVAVGPFGCEYLRGSGIASQWPSWPGYSKSNAVLTHGNLSSLWGEPRWGKHLAVDIASDVPSQRHRYATVSCGSRR